MGKNDDAQAGKTPSSISIDAEQFLEQQKLLTQILQNQLNLQQQNVSANTGSVTTTPPAVVQPSAAIPPPSKFSFRAENWEDWKVSFMRYKRTALVSYNSEQLVDYLIGFLGIQGEKMLKFFHLSESEIKDINKVLTEFDKYFASTKNLVYERVKFLQRVQKAGEPCDNFINDLTALAQTCEWDTLEKELIKLKLIAGLSDARLSAQLQAKNDEKLEEVIKRIRLAESLRLQQSTVRATAEAPLATPIETERRQEQGNVDAVYRAGRTQNGQNKKPGKFFTAEGNNSNADCRKCGQKPRHAFANCPARKDTCNRCGLIGHWQSKCRSKNTQKNEQHSGHKTKIAAAITEPAQSASQMQNNRSSVGEEIDFFLGSVTEEKTSIPWRTTVLVSGVAIECKIDTGADVTVIKQEIYRKLWAGKLETPIKPLLSASGDKLNILGTFDTQIQWRDKNITTKIYVAEKLHENLLSRDAIEKLGMLSWAGSVSISEQYSSLFEGIGNLGNPYHIKLKPSATPFSISTPRRVAIHLRDAVKIHLENLEKSQIIFKVTEPTAWCAPMVVVPKKDGKVRTCVDYTMINQSVETEKLVLPEITEALALIDPGSQYFSKLDAASGFYHIPLDKESQLLTTFITPFGRFAFRRLPMGITSATERFQREMADTLEGLEGVVNVADDTLVTGRTKAEHDNRLEKVLERFKNCGLKLNKTKCIFGAQKLIFLGHVVSKDGISIDPEKIAAINNMSGPTNVSGVRQILGSLQMHAKFISNLSDLANPLNQLLNKNSEFCWTEVHKDAFKKIKTALTTAPILAHFAPGRPTRVAADASSYGLGATLEQKNGDQPWRPVCYASRTLSDTEKRYAQIEKEALASTWACEKFKQYLIGQDFTIQTDHKPLVVLLGTKPISDLPARIQRFRMRLMQFCYKVEYIPGKLMIIPDMLSRAPIESSDPGTDALLIDDVTVFVECITQNTPILEQRLLKILQSQKSNEQCGRLVNYINNGWPQYPADLTNEDRIFFQYRGELTIQNGLITKANRIYVTPDMRHELLDKIHEGHFGVVKCRSRAKESIWWPGISTQISEKVAKCTTCIQHRNTPTEPLIPTPMPEYPYQKIGADLCEVRGSNFLVVTDYFSRYIEIAHLQTQTAHEVIVKMKNFMARWGIPEVVRSDNGPCFKAFEFAEFARDFKFQHSTSSPTFAQSNGQAESGVKIAKKILIKNEDSNLGLLTYRTIKLECGYSPAELIMGRTPRSSIPQIKNKFIPEWSYIEDFKAKRQVEIEKQTINFNQRHRVHESKPIEANDRVWITNQKCFGKVVNIGPEPRSYVIQGDNNQIYRRNRAHLILVDKENLADADLDLEFDLPEEREEVTPQAQPQANMETPIPAKGRPRVKTNEAQRPQETVTRYGRTVRPTRSCGCLNYSGGCQH